MFRGRTWLKNGGCTGKGDWEERTGENSESNEGGDVKRVRTEGICRGIDDTNPEHDKVRDRGLEREERGHGSGAGDDPRRYEPAHGVAGDRFGGGGASGGGRAAELPSTAYTGGLVHDWVRDEPFVRGGYTYPRFGFDENTHADAAASVNGSLFFAGEHTNTPTGMTVHAAIDSGERCGVLASKTADNHGVGLRMRCSEQ